MNIALLFCFSTTSGLEKTPCQFLLGVLGLPRGSWLTFSLSLPGRP